MIWLTLIELDPIGVAYSSRLRCPEFAVIRFKKMLKKCQGGEAFRDLEK